MGSRTRALRIVLPTPRFHAPAWQLAREEATHVRGENLSYLSRISHHAAGVKEKHRKDHRSPPWRGDPETMRRGVEGEREGAALPGGSSALLAGCVASEKRARRRRVRTGAPGGLDSPEALE